MGRRDFAFAVGVSLYLVMIAGIRKDISCAETVEVTLMGSMVCNGACISDPKDADHTLVIFAIDGTTEVRDEVDAIMKEFYPDEGLDADAAQKLMDQFSARLKFYLSPDSPALQDAKYQKNKGVNHYCMPAVASADPGFPAKYKEQNSTGLEGFKSPLKVKSRKPNAWGLYDMASCWWEITANKGTYNVRQAETDPYYPPGIENARSQRSGRGIIQDSWSIGTHEFITEKADYAGQKFRVLVEAE